MENFDYLSVLNFEQLQAVTHTGTPLLILAGAGSGKTRVITTKIAYLIDEIGIDPKSILSVTFTKKAANEMKERATQLSKQAYFSQIKTFHSFGAWFLRLYADEANLSATFTVYDDDDMVTLLLKACPTITKAQAKMTAHKISLAKDYCYTPEDPRLINIDSDPEFRDFYAKYQERLEETGNVDFGDLIMKPVLMLQKNPKINQEIHDRFKVIMVDEYQDTNVAQFLLLKQLFSENAYICVVGDDDQSIYKFRGADISNILDFNKEFENTTTIRLQKNYRSTGNILKCANDVIKNNKGRLGKTLEQVREDGKKPTLAFLANSDDEASLCYELVSQSHKKGIAYSDWAILYRTNAQSLNFEKIFNRFKIPYKIVGSLKFFEREEIKDLLCFCKLVANPKDEVSFRRIINKPVRGIGSATQEKVIDKSRESAKNELIQGNGLIDACLSIKDISAKSKTGLQFFGNLMLELQQMIANTKTVESQIADKSLDTNTNTDDTLIQSILQSDNLESQNIANSTEQTINNQAEIITKTDTNEQNNSSQTELKINLGLFIKKIIVSSGLSEYYTQQDEIAGTQKVLNMQELCNIAMSYSLTAEGLIAFLDQVELDRTLETQNDSSDDCVTLITIHNTKGLEFKRVVITGLEYGLFPRKEKVDDEIEEERRLFYVAITRAKDQLYLTSSSVRHLYGHLEYMEISPFLTEISPENLEVLGKQPPKYKNHFARNTRTLDGCLVNANSENAKWRRGKAVYHDDFGNGIITKATLNDDGELVITVHFECGHKEDFLPSEEENSLTTID